MWMALKMEDNLHLDQKEDLKIYNRYHLYYIEKSGSSGSGGTIEIPLPISVKATVKQIETKPIPPHQKPKPTRNQSRKPRAVKADIALSTRP